MLNNQFFFTVRQSICTDKIGEIAYNLHEIQKSKLCQTNLDGCRKLDEALAKINKFFQSVC